MQDNPELLSWELHSRPGAPQRFHLGCIATDEGHLFLASLLERGPDSFDLYLEAKVSGSPLLLTNKSKDWIEGYLTKLKLPLPRWN